MGEDVIRVRAEPVPSNAVQHMVPMRDGIMIASDVYLPAEDGSVETVLVRLPYDKDSRYVFMDQVAPHFTSRGYAVVVQDVRGKFRSGGETIGLVNESEDGYDSIEWITQQQWSNGVVGMFGDSYYGFTQWAAVSAEHPALKAIVPRVTSADLFAEPSHGATSDVPWLVAADYLSHYWVDNEIQEFPLDYDRRPMTEIFEDAFRRIGARSRLYDALVPDVHPIDSFPFGHPFDAAPVPVLHVVGWFDNILIPSMRDYVALSQRTRVGCAPVPVGGLGGPRELPPFGRSCATRRRPPQEREGLGPVASHVCDPSARLLRRLSEESAIRGNHSQGLMAPRACRIPGVTELATA